jgi:tetratricopeptide (TPR) repeat protein
MNVQQKSTLADVYQSIGDENADLLTALRAKAKYHLDHQHLDLADHYYRRCLKIDPLHYWAHMGLGKLCTLREHFREAVDIYRQALDISESSSQKAYALCGLANALTGQGKVAEAETLYLQAIEETPDHPFAYTGLALLYENFLPPPWEKIIDQYRKAITLAPKEASWINPKIAKAEESLSRIVAGLEDNEADKVLSRQQMMVLFGQDRLVDVLENHLKDQQPPYIPTLRQVFAQLHSIPPGHFSAIEFFYLFVADGLAGDPDAETRSSAEDLALAKRFYELALAEQNPLPAECYVRILRNYLRSGDFEDAQASVVQAVSHAGDDAKVLLMAAKVMQTGHPGAARLLMGRALELAPEMVSEEAGGEDQAWLDLAAAHDRANKSKTEKFGSIKKWLDAMPASTMVQRHTQSDAAALDNLDQWLDEFFRLLSTHPPELLIDLPHYRKQTGFWFKTLDQALIHYFEKGWQKGVSVHAAFDDDYVRHQLRLHGIDTTAEPLLLLFLRHEPTLGMAPNVLFDPALYRAGVNTEGNASLWLHYLSGGWKQNGVVSPYFDTDYFIRRIHRNSIKAALPPLLRYFCENPLGDTNPLFHAAYYANRYKDLLRDKAPLAHYLSEGAYLGCSPNPFFVPNGRTARERIDYLRLPQIEC